MSLPNLVSAYSTNIVVQGLQIPFEKSVWRIWNFGPVGGLENTGLNGSDDLGCVTVIWYASTDCQ